MRNKTLFGLFTVFLTGVWLLTSGRFFAAEPPVITRSISPSTVEGRQRIVVTLTISNYNNEPYYKFEERIPDGFVVNVVDDLYDAKRGNYKPTYDAQTNIFTGEYKNPAGHENDRIDPLYLTRKYVVVASKTPGNYTFVGHAKWVIDENPPTQVIVGTSDVTVNSVADPNRPLSCQNIFVDTDLGEKGIDCNRSGGPCANECPFYLNPHPRVLFTQETLNRTRCRVGEVEAYRQYCPADEWGVLHGAYLKVKDGGYRRGINLWTAERRASTIKNVLQACVVSGDETLCNFLHNEMMPAILDGSVENNDYLISGYDLVTLYYDWFYDQISPQLKDGYGRYVAKSAEEAYSPKNYEHALLYNVYDKFFLPYLSASGAGLFADTIAYEGVRDSIHYFSDIKVPIYNELFKSGEVVGYMSKGQALYMAGAMYLAAFEGSLANDLMNRSAWMRQVPYFLLYRTRPDGLFGEFLAKHQTSVDISFITTLHSSYYHDPVTKSYAEKYKNTECMTTVACPPAFFLFYDPAIPSGDYTGLPKAKHLEGVGGAYFRSDWKTKGTDSGWQESIWGFFANAFKITGEGLKMGGTSNHLAISRGEDFLVGKRARFFSPDNWFWIGNWFGRSVSHNTALVYDPNESFGVYAGVTPNVPYDNDGGSCCGSQAMGDIKYPIINGFAGSGQGGVKYAGTVSEFQQDENFVYMKGDDAEYAYKPGKVNKFTRQLAYLQPDVFVVFDRLDANPAFDKAILWQVVNEPQLDVDDEQIIEGTDLDHGGVFDSYGSTMFSAERGSSKIFIKTLLPLNNEMKLRKIGGGNAIGEEFVQDEWPYTTDQRPGEPTTPIFYSSFDDSYEWYYAGRNNPPVALNPDQNIGRSRGGPAWEEWAGRNDVKVTPTGDWRIEVRPTSQQPRQTEYFLSVLWPTARETANMVPTELITSVDGNMVGTLIGGNKAVMFSKQGGRISSSSFMINAQGNVQLLLTDLVLNSGYDVRIEENTVHLSLGSQHISSDQGVLSLNVNLGQGHVNQPPYMETVPPQQVNVGETVRFVVRAHDPDGDQTITNIFPVSNLPEGAEFTYSGGNTATFSWITDSGDVGSYAFSFVARDNGGLESVALVVPVTVNSTNHPPVLNPIGDKQIDEGQLLEFTITASDPDGDSLSFPVPPNLPEGAVFTDNHNNTATFSWTPGFNWQGGHSLNLEVRDAGNLNDNEQIVVTVNNINRIPVFYDTVVDYTMRQGETISVPAYARDDDSADTVTIVPTLKPSWVTVVSSAPGNPANMILRARPDETAAADNTILLKAWDNHNGWGYIGIRIHVTLNNAAPYFYDTQQLYEIPAGGDMQFTARAKDDNSEDVVTMDVLEKPQWVGFSRQKGNPARIVFRARPPEGILGNYPIRLRATDNHSAFVQFTITINVNGAQRTQTPSKSNIWRWFLRFLTSRWNM